MSDELMEVLSEQRYGGQTYYQIDSFKVFNLVNRRHDHDCLALAKHYRLADRDGRRSTWLVCERCGRKVRKAAAGLSVWVEDGDAVVASKAKAWSDLLQAERDRVNAAGIRLVERLNKIAERQRRAEYDAYLQTETWQAKRAKILARCGGLCEGCGERRALEVHHLTYAHFGDELLFELVALCKPCHGRVHIVHNSDDSEYAL